MQKRPKMTPQDFARLSPTAREDLLVEEFDRLNRFGGSWPPPYVQELAKERGVLPLSLAPSVEKMRRVQDARRAAAEERTSAPAMPACASDDDEARDTSAHRNPEGDDAADLDLEDLGAMGRTETVIGSAATDAPRRRAARR